MPNPPDDAGAGRRRTDHELELPADVPLTLARTLWRFDGRLRELARGLGELRDRLHDVETILESMTEAEKIAHAVTVALEHDRRARFTFTRKAVAVLAGAVLLVPAVHELILWAFG